MITKLGLDTIVEGVETIEQVKFLREVGCSKMQGFFFAKPIPLDEWYTIYGAKVGNVIEETIESDYYSAVGKINIVEPVVNTDYNWRVNEFFGQMPTGIIELREEGTYVLRYNRNFATFLMKMGYLDELDLGNAMIRQKRQPTEDLIAAIKRCDESDTWVYVESIQDKEYLSNCYFRKIAVNPKFGYRAYEVVIFSIDHRA
jgi:hypothetical protein